jgi:SAM-dependent methyltransferase
VPAWALRWAPMSSTTAGHRARTLPSVPAKGLGRSLALARVFRLEQPDPETFYRVVALDTVRQIREYTEVSGKTVIDVGGGGGFFTEALTEAGARSVLVEPDTLIERSFTPKDAAHPTSSERHRLAVQPGRHARGITIAGDGYRLPFDDGVADLVFSSNVLEHVANPTALVAEMIRVTRPGGLLYISFTAWYSPWGGHETAPWHYLGGERAARRYETKNGHPPKNRYGVSLFPFHVGSALRMARSFSDRAVLVDALPRYYPHWMRFVIHVPAVRELATWNLLLVMCRRADSTPKARP